MTDGLFEGYMMLKQQFQEQKGKTDKGTSQMMIIAQSRTTMDILSKHFPDEEHILVFNNTTTHLKLADDALSAIKMPNPKSESSHGRMQSL
jgi:hypothetical protein